MRRFGRAAAALLAVFCAVPALADTAPDPRIVALAPVPPGKLTDAARPLAYRLDLTIDPNRERFSGRTEIDAALKAPSRFVDLHGRGLAMHHAEARVGGRSIPAIWTQLDESGVVRLTFAEPLPAGNVTLAFDYDAPFQEGPSGLFRVKVGPDWYSWSQFESIDARSAFPAFDEPGFKTPWSVTLRTPPGLMAVSNTPEASVTREGGLDVHRFAPTLPLPSYLVAMMVGPFAHADGAVPATAQRPTPLPLRVVSTRQNAGQLKFALTGSEAIVARLEDYFGEPFPFPKLDQITSPIMPGAMENAGADLYDDNILVMNENAPVNQQRRFGMIVAHELSHQWFGDMVSPKWWDDIWLNESFANWMGYRIGNAWKPSLDIASGALVEGFQAMDTDALAAGRPIHQHIAASAQADATFDNITYGKGGHVVAMIAAFMGDQRFRDGVRGYMAAHRYGSASTADFFAAMAKAGGDPRILPAMQSFTDQQGVPLLTFTGGDGRYAVTQSRYARLGTTMPPARWGVPLCVRRGSVRQCQLLTEPSGTVALGGSGPLMPNAGGTGYYRFELPRADWDALIARSDKLPPGEALALDDSLTASFEAGRASATQLAELARVMVRNPNSHAAQAAFGGLDMLFTAGLLDEPAQAAYRAFVRQQFRPLLGRRPLDPRLGVYSGEDPDLSQRRYEAVRRLTTTGRDEALRHTLDVAAQAYLSGNHGALDPMWYSLALAERLRAGKLDAAHQVLDAALVSEDPVFRPAALGALGGSGQTEIARWLLDGVKDSRLRWSERLSLVTMVIANDQTADFGYQWMRAHLDALLSGGGGVFLAGKLPHSLSNFCTAERAEEIARDLGPRFAGQTGELELQRAVERVRSCAVLKAARGAEASREIAALR